MECSCSLARSADVIGTDRSRPFFGGPRRPRYADRRTVSSPVVRSTSSHARANSSPRRSPVLSAVQKQRRPLRVVRVDHRQESLGFAGRQPVELRGWPSSRSWWTWMVSGKRRGCSSFGSCTRAETSRGCVGVRIRSAFSTVTFVPSSTSARSLSGSCTIISRRRSQRTCRLGAPAIATIRGIGSALALEALLRGTLYRSRQGRRRGSRQRDSMAAPGAYSARAGARFGEPHVAPASRRAFRSACLRPRARANDRQTGEAVSRGQSPAGRGQSLRLGRG